MSTLPYATSHCQSCGIAAPTRNVSFNQNVGMLLMRRRTSFNGQVCKNCLHKRFWSMTGITLAIGWLGTISVILAPIFVLGNLFYYLKNIGMPAPPKVS